MNQLSNLMDFVMVDGGQPVTNSRKVATHFGKRHRDVLRAIRNLDCSSKFTERNFAQCFEINYLANGKPEPVIQMTKDGFMFLVMGFTGKAAAAMKEAFIEAFNAMSEMLRSGLWQRRMDAEAAYPAGKSQASIDGRGLCQWRREKPHRLREIAELDRQMQIPLQLH